MSWGHWRPYVPVARRRANALREMRELRGQGRDIQPVQISGREIARSFWGKGWCDHLESFSDYENRLPRGRTYVRNGSVCHLDVQPGRIEAIVSGSELYNIRIAVKNLKPAIWKSVKQKCSGRIGSMLELLQGKLSEQVMTVVSDRAQGLFPQPREIELRCSCPDWAVMCKHVAAVLYGVGSRLDTRPELLFLLRDVDAQELISTEFAIPDAAISANQLNDDQLSDIFGIELDGAVGDVGDSAVTSKQPVRARRRAAKKTAARSRRSGARSNSKPAAGHSGNGKAPVENAGAAKRPARGRANNHFQANGTVPAGSTFRATGASVARLRRRLGLSRAELAEQLGVSVASVIRWEAIRGKLKLQARTSESLARMQSQARP